MMSQCIRWLKSRIICKTSFLELWYEAVVGEKLIYLSSDTIPRIRGQRVFDNRRNLRSFPLVSYRWHNWLRWIFLKSNLAGLARTKRPISMWKKTETRKGRQMKQGGTLAEPNNVIKNGYLQGWHISREPIYANNHFPGPLAFSSPSSRLQLAIVLSNPTSWVDCKSVVQIENVKAHCKHHTTMMYYVELCRLKSLVACVKWKNMRQNYMRRKTWKYRNERKTTANRRDGTLYTCVLCGEGL